MTKADCIRELLTEYQAQQMRNSQELDARIEEAGRIDPEILRLREENMHLAFDTMRRVMTMEKQEEKIAAAEAMKQRGIFNNGEIRRRLSAAGFPGNYLEMQYRCPICRDTAYVGDAPSRFCDCFENRLRRMQYENGTMSGTDEQCFARFDITRFPEENGQRAQMAGIRKFCEDYAGDFPETRFANIVFTGSGGLGKTFLLNCIYERVVSRGFPAIRVTAFRMFESMRCQYLGKTGGDMDFDQLLSVPLLLVDDLGSEPMMRNVTVEYLFTLLNERNAAKKHTVIATNLSPMQLKETYGERVFSRLLDRSLCATMNLTGKDLRLL